MRTWLLLNLSFCWYYGIMTLIAAWYYGIMTLRAAPD
jgi:hypothetical protein